MFETEGIICARTRAGERLGWLAMMGGLRPFFFHTLGSHTEKRFFYG